MIGYYNDLDFDTLDAPARPRRKSHYFLAALVFVAAYFTTITVHAQPQDAIVLNSNKFATVVGTVKAADDNYVDIVTAGKDMRIVLDDVNLSGEADTIFTPGMTVTVDGIMKGEDFGVPLMSARSITATAPATGAGAAPEVQ